MRFNCFSPVFAIALITTFVPTARGGTFVEDFEDGNASTRFTTSSINTPAIDYAYDYSAYGIPPAPNSSGGSTGVRMAARTAFGNAAGAVAAIRNGTAITGNYVMTVDMWINYNGGAGGGSGSTEMAFWGLNNTGSGVLDGQFAGGTADGYAFSATGEGGAGADYQVYYTDPTDDGPSYPKTNAVWAAGGNTPDINGSEPDNNLHNYYDDPVTGIFSSPPFETAGSPGKQWIQVRVEQVGNTVSTFMNDFPISTLSLAEAADGDGHAYLSYADIFTGSSPPEADLQDVFVVFDNLQVIPEPGAMLLCIFGALGLLIRRRRG